MDESTTSEERWLHLPYEGYEVSSLGRVRHYYTGHVYRPSVNSITGYAQVSLKINGSYCNKYVHRLVAMMFCEGGMKNHDDKNMQVDHIDGNRTNNCASNLRWVSRKQNNSTSRARMKSKRRNITKTTKTLVRISNSEGHQKWFYSANDAKEYIGCSHVLIVYALQGRIKTAFGWTVERFGRDEDEVQCDEEAMELIKQEKDREEAASAERSERFRERMREAYRRRKLLETGKPVRKYTRKAKGDMNHD